MQELDDMALLREYAAGNSEAAFETLVSRRVNFVYSAAMRQTRDPHLSEEITQAVFIILAQKAGKISDKTILTGWLFKTTRFVALAQTRATLKRKQREQEAHMQSEIQHNTTDALWEQMSPLLDEALAQLGEKDRQAVLLRFFEKRNFAEVGSHLGTGEDTARKRTIRALEKLRNYFSKRGVVSTTAIIAGIVSANSVQAAPSALATSISAAAITKGAVVNGSTLTLIKGALKLMAWTKAKMAAVVGVSVLFATGVTAIVLKQIDRSPLDDATWKELGSAFGQAPNRVFLRLSHFTNSGCGGGSDGMTIGRAVSINKLMSIAYGIDEKQVSFSTKPPNGNYDFIMSIPNNREALPTEIKKKLGLIGRRETRPTDVFLLKLQNTNAQGLKITESPQVFVMPSAVGWPIMTYSFTNRTIDWFVGFLDEKLHKTIIDQTGLTNHYDLTLKWNGQKDKPDELLFERVLPEQLGLQLVPSREPIEVLVVEKVK